MMYDLSISQSVIVLVLLKRSCADFKLHNKIEYVLVIAVTHAPILIWELLRNNICLSMSI